MASNDDLLNAIVRHQVDILRFSKGEALTALGILDKADADLVKRISARAANGLSQVGTDRLEAILQDVRESRAKVFKRLKSNFDEKLTGLAEHEIAFENAVLTASVPFVLNLKGVPAARLKALAKDPVRGLPLNGWLDNMEKADVDRLVQAITLAAVEGDTVEQIISRLGPGFATTKRNTEALARTAINHVSNKSREEVWLANEDIIDGLRWTSTLDGRTSPICQARDGEVAAVGDKPLPPGSDPLDPPFARPPAHFNCRSVMVPIIDGESALGDRPFVRDRRRPGQRLKDFRADAKLKAGDKWKTWSVAQRNKAIAAERKAWAAANIGRVPAKTTYEQWLRKQPKTFQNEVLGPARAKLFRQGSSLDRFVDTSGKMLNLKQLAAEGAQQTLAVSQPGIGLKAMSLLQQGFSTQQVLFKILKEFPDANTTAASIASYKSKLKKAGQLNTSDKILKSGIGGDFDDVAIAVQNFTNNLPPGVKNAVGNGWYQIVDDLSGGHYAHYKAGYGVQISNKKMLNISAAQVDQILAHELGHFLHKKFPDALKIDDGYKLRKFVKEATNNSPGFKKNYGYYLSHADEMHAELYAQALKPSPITSQGLLAKDFNFIMSDHIEIAKKKLLAKFPEPTPLKVGKVYSNGAPTPASALVGVDPQDLGITGYIKELLKQNMNGDDILAAVKAEFPEAATTKASIASTKSVMKKQGLLGSPASKVTIDAPQTKAGIKPQIKDTKPVFTSAKDVAAAKGYLDPASGTVKMQYLSVTQQKAKAKTVLLELLKAGKVGPNAALSEQITALFPKAGMKATNVASFKSQWKKKGLWGETDIADLGLPEPKLKLSQMGSHSKKALIEAEQMFANGASHQQVTAFMEKHFGSWNPTQGADLMYLAEYNAKLGKFSGSKAAQAVSKAKPTVSVGSVDMTPIRKANSPTDGWPPPPRFTDEQHQAGFKKILGGYYSTSTPKASIQKALKAAGVEPLTVTEYSVLREYTGSAYQSLNRKLRSGEYADDIYLQAVVDAGQSALRKMHQASAYKHIGVVNRGTSLSANHYELFKKTYVKGAVIEEHGFLSTSTAHGFSGRVRFKINSKTGIKVRELSRHPSENEVLFMPGVKFRIDEVIVNNANHTTTVHMTEIYP